MSCLLNSCLLKWSFEFYNFLFSFITFFTDEVLSFDSEEIQVGDWVTIGLEPDIFMALQEGHGGWNDRMLDVSQAK